MRPDPMLSLQVAEVGTPAPGVRSLTLVPDDGSRLPGFPPGAHVGIEWRPGRVNPYSLTGSGRDPDAYRVSVALRPDGSGGSRWVHGVRVRDRVRVTRPRSSFPPVETAAHHVLVAGGIGVTPVLAHVRWHAFWGNSFEVLLVQRPGVTPHADDLHALAGDRLRLAHDRAALHALLDPALGGAPFNSHVYTCGPPGLIADVAATARDAHWIDARIHAEPFVHAPEPGPPFTAVLRRARREVPVAEGESLLDALDRAGVPARHLCRQGVCGECVTGLLAGRADHRDTVLTAADRADRIALCVSRGRDGATLELDL